MSTSISEEFKDAKINLMIEDLLKLESEISNYKQAIIDAISEVPTALETVVTVKLTELLSVGEELEKNISVTKEEIIDLKENAKHEITKHISLVLSDLKTEVKSLSDTYKSEIKKTKPVSVSKLVIYFMISLMLLTSLCSGAFYYVLSAQHKAELQKYGTGLVELSEFTDDVIKQLPKDKRADADSRYKKIMSSDR